ncbi:MAG: hypothetical protein AAF235_03110 [Planctomycetota bacterium]
MNFDNATVLGVPGDALNDPERRAAVSSFVKRVVRTGCSVILVVGAASPSEASLMSPTADVLDRAAATVEAATRQAIAARDDLRWIGVHAVLADPRETGPVARGHVLSAEPRTIRVRRLAELAEDADVVVMPGDAGVNSSGDVVSLGEDGEELTAVFIGDKLAIPVRLLRTHAAGGSESTAWSLPRRAALLARSTGVNVAYEPVPLPGALPTRQDEPGARSSRERATAVLDAVVGAERRARPQLLAS